jgi:phosphate transport system substrate-binding protein
MPKLASYLLALAVIALIPTAADAAGALVIDGSTTVGPIAKAFAEYYMALNPNVNITVSESGSGNGAKSLINGVCLVADMSRFMKEKEYTAAADAGITPVAHVVALRRRVGMVFQKPNPFPKTICTSPELSRLQYHPRFTDNSPG